MAPSSSHRLSVLFDRYLRRDLSSSEVEELVSLLAQADAEEVLSEPMRRLWDELKFRPDEYGVDWDRMYRKVSRAEEGWRRDGLVVDGGGEGEGGGEFWRVWGWRAVSAVFLGLAGLAAYWSVAYRRPVAVGAAGRTVVVVKKNSGGPVKVLSWQTAENKRVIHLPDGSMVILNTQSQLEYRVTDGREVVLHGEAYFDILGRPGLPFLVHTGKIVTRVLGTAFNIRAYPTERSIEVTVDHGKVQVFKGGSNMGLLSDRQQMRYDLRTEVYHARQVSLKSVMAWKPAEIRYDDITMGEAARRIGERFNVGFDFINPALKECRITATFYMEDDLDQIMTVICGVNQSRFVIEGNLVKIDGKGCD